MTDLYTVLPDVVHPLYASWPPTWAGNGEGA